MSYLYARARDQNVNGELIRQRVWLRKALRCAERTCLIAHYDERNGELLAADGGAGPIERFHFEMAEGNGNLSILRMGDWITYDAVQTIVGPGGAAAGDVYSARLSGTARVREAVVRDRKGNGCEVLLVHVRDGSWSIETRHCFESDRADLNGNYRPSR